MVARCETIGKYIMPVFRSLIAKELVTTYNLTQLETAQKLGTTQAAVSQYINSKRAFKSTQQVGNMMPKLEKIAKETAKRLAKSEITSDEIVLDFCKLCSSFGVEEPKQTGDNYTI
jgi:predicted transcriptional regulator